MCKIIKFKILFNKKICQNKLDYLIFVGLDSLGFTLQSSIGIKMYRYRLSVEGHHG